MGPAISSSLLLVIVLIFAVEGCQAITCQKDYYKIEYKDGRPPTCQHCPDCPDGQGPLVPCGKTLQHPARIECSDCIPGKTYSNDHGTSSCKACHICAKGIKINCTVFDDTVCLKQCEPGKYYENATHDCQPCSYCCGDNTSDIRIAECVKQGISHDRQCSIHNAQKCTPPSSQPPISRSTPVSSTQRDTGQKGTLSTGEIIGISAGSCVGGVILAIVFFCARKYKRKMRQRNINLNVSVNGDVVREDEQRERMLPDGRCSLQLFEPDDRQVERNVIEDLPVSFKCQINGQNRKCHPKYQWLKDNEEIVGQTALELILACVKMEDFGFYRCHIRCSCGTNVTLKTTEQELNVSPSPLKRYKLFSDMGVGKDDEVAHRLARDITEVGNWKIVGQYYGISKNKLESLEQYKPVEAAKEVIQYLHSNKPRLTVYSFCKYLKTINQMVIVEKLKDEMTELIATANRDSGMYDRYSDGSPKMTNAFYQPNTVHLPPGPSAPPESLASMSQPDINQLDLPVDNGPTRNEYFSDYTDFPPAAPQAQYIVNSGHPRGAVRFAGVVSDAYTDSPAQSDDEHLDTPSELEALSTKERKKSFGRQSSSGSNKSTGEDGDSSSDMPPRRRSRSSSMSSVKSTLETVKDNIKGKLTKQNSGDKENEILIVADLSSEDG